jgi:hypothetical protein
MEEAASTCSMHRRLTTWESRDPSSGRRPHCSRGRPWNGGTPHRADRSALTFEDLQNFRTKTLTFEVVGDVPRHPQEAGIHKVYGHAQLHVTETEDSRPEGNQHSREYVSARIRVRRYVLSVCGCTIRSERLHIEPPSKD